MIKNIFWLTRVSLYSIAFSALGSNNFLIPVEKDALSAMQLPVPAKVKTQRRVMNVVQRSTKIYPQTMAEPELTVSVRSGAFQKTNSVYQCQENNGQTVFSDKPCGNVQRVTSIDSLRPNTAEAFKRVKQMNVSRNLRRPNQTNTRNRANQQEINTRYDNLRRVIIKLLKDDPGHLNELLIRLNNDRQKALSMYEKSENSYSIHQRYDNRKRDIRRQEGEKSSRWVANRILKLEQNRSHELYAK